MSELNRNDHLLDAEQAHLQDSVHFINTFEMDAIKFMNHMMNKRGRQFSHNTDLLERVEEIEGFLRGDDE